MYLRMSRGDTPAVYEHAHDFTIGRAVTLAAGNDLTIIATGCQIVPQALRAAELLAGDGLSVRVPQHAHVEAVR